MSAYSLRTFGTLGLSGSNDESLLGKHGQQKRRLALLAVLAAAGEKGRSRDQLLLLFWPDATQTRARHSLEQLLYALRSSLHEEVFAGSNPVRLNEAIVASDVASFNNAMERKDFEMAARLYQGPFLDGFYLNDSPEFEQWQTTERARLERSYASALERLATDSSRDPRAASTWWQKLVDTDPLSSRYAAGYMRALAEGGDRAGAIQYAERYQSLVSRELGAGAGPEVSGLVAELRAQSRVEVAENPTIESSRPSVSIPSAREDPAAAGSSLSMPTRNRTRIYLASAGVVVIAIMFIIGLSANLRSVARVPAVPSSIAVLPFANVSGNQNDAPIVDGVTEEMIAMLGNIPGLRPIARTSVFAFRNSNLDVRQIADSLGVANVLEGSVQKDDSALRVRVRLVDGHDGSTRWSETYDRKLENLLSVQSEIAEAVARELNVRLGATALSRMRSRGTRNVAAYEFYLRGSDPTLTRSDSAARIALGYFRQAIALDSNYAEAHAGMARFLMRAGNATQSRSEWAKTVALAKAAAEKAIALNDSSGDAHATLGLVFRNIYHVRAAETEMRTAIMLDPANVRYREWMVAVLIVMGKPADALSEGRRAIEMDPLSPTANAEYARALIANDRCDEALARLDKLKSLRPRLLRVGNLVVRCHVKRQMWDSALAYLRQINPNGEREPLMLYLKARRGNRQESEKFLPSFIERYNRSGRGAFAVATLYAGLQNADEMFRWLDRAYEDQTLTSLDEVADGFEEDPRYERILQRLNSQ